jgi:hypothetical protein
LVCEEVRIIERTRIYEGKRESKSLPGFENPNKGRFK